MRRLTAFADKKPRFILASATLGQKGKSEGEIVSFARKLTSANFSEKDIVFADRVPFRKALPAIELSGSEYADMLKDHATIAPIANKFGIESRSSSDQEALFDLLHHDENVARLYELLKGGSRDVRDVAACMPRLSSEELTALIDLVNFARKDGMGIFDLKYHSFVRPLSGAYVSFGSRPALSLMKTNQIDGNRAFELGNCRYCNTPFVIGKLCKSKADGLTYLIQNDEVDIYENYGDNTSMLVDFFLLENAVENSEIDAETVEKYSVCSKCGAAYASDNLKALQCDCGEESQVTMYRVLSRADSDSTAYNNLNKCPCCGRLRNAGVVKNLSLGKDETTAILSQTLLESMDVEGASEQKKKLSLKLVKKSPNAESGESGPDAKQFLAFSDSRSQASYFAAFFNVNHSRLLRKRLLWEVIKDSGFREIRVEKLEAMLEGMIRNGNLFDNGLSDFKNAWISILVELLRIDGRNSCEGVGIYHFELDLSPVMNQFEDADIEAEFGKYGCRTKRQLTTLIRILFNVQAVDFSIASLTPEERQEYLPYRSTFDAIELRSSKSRKGVRSLLPIKGKDNMVVRFVEKAFGCDQDTANDVIEICFNLLKDSGILEHDASSNAFRISASRYVLNNYKNVDYYRCDKCGRVTPLNYGGVCFTNKCEGHLHKIDPDVELAQNFYRKQYLTKKIERMVVEEHTAQLDRKRAKQYQNDFKNKKINVLSCSTTFEMGVDIGSLETVFMRNVPPSPANYVQRAGRAGRRADSSAYVLTYCGTNSHDYTYFLNPSRMISGIINPPYFDVLNKKIVVRHLMSASLGYFFRENPGYFASVEALVFDGGIGEFKKYLLSKPRELMTYVDERVIPESEYASVHGLKWFSDMNGNDEKLQHFEEAMRNTLAEFNDAKSVAVSKEDYDDAKYFEQQIASLKKRRVIDSLSEYCVIPKYGFPIDVVNLDIYERGRRQKTYDLSRDLKIGISEYAPDSEVIVDKKKYTSKYITLPKGSSLPRRCYVECPECGKMNVGIAGGSLAKCQNCDEDLTSQVVRHFFEPIYGFKTGESKQGSYLKPKRTYSGDVSYLGGGLEDERALILGAGMSIQTSSNDELLVMNKETFHFCKVCGYGEVVGKKVQTPSITKKHKNYRAYDCSNEKLESIHLGHRFQTDVARISIDLLSASGKSAYPRALSFMYAFLEGTCLALEIERTDLNALLELDPKTGSYDILMYDNVPGGAGLVKRLMSKGAVIEALQAALEKVSQDCCDDDTTCYKCLRNYYNQRHHASLKRRYARELISDLLASVQSAEETYGTRA